MLGLVVCQCVFVFRKQLSISSCCHTLPNSLEKVFYHFLQSLWWNWCQCLFVEMFVEFVNLTIAYCCDSIIKKHQLLLTNYTLLYQLPITIITSLHSIQFPTVTQLWRFPTVTQLCRWLTTHHLQHYSTSKQSQSSLHSFQFPTVTQLWRWLPLRMLKQSSVTNNSPSKTHFT